jgi:hypothetical protein
MTGQKSVVNNLRTKVNMLSSNPSVHLRKTTAPAISCLPSFINITTNSSAIVALLNLNCCKQMICKVDEMRFSGRQAVRFSGLARRFGFEKSYLLVNQCKDRRF